MKTNHFLMGCAFAILTLTACDPLGVRGRGDLTTETRDVKNFHAIEVDVSGDVDVRVDSFFHVEVTCEDNIIDFLETVEDHGVLKIFFDRNVYDVDNLKIRVSAPSWNAFEINGSADVDVPDAISGDFLNLGISGSGNIKIFDASFNKAKSRISGSGDITLIGEANDLNATISGSGDLQAIDFPVKTATVTVSGSGNARVNVSDMLNVTISGSGDVQYSGNPQVSKSISGSGSVKKI